MARFPCKNCKDRYFACHDSCGRYQEARQKNEEYKAKRNAKNVIIQYKQDGFSKVLSSKATNRR